MYWFLWNLEIAPSKGDVGNAILDTKDKINFSYFFSMQLTIMCQLPAVAWYACHEVITFTWHLLAQCTLRKYLYQFCSMYLRWYCQPLTLSNKISQKQLKKTRVALWVYSQQVANLFLITYIRENSRPWETDPYILFTRAVYTTQLHTSLYDTIACTIKCWHSLPVIT